jgi:hypothetical protein
MAQFMLLLRGGGGDEAADTLTPEQMQAMVQPYIEWSAKLRRAGQLLAADELAGGGRVVRNVAGRLTIDGPYTETKENIGGYYTIEAEDEAAALEIAKECPILRKGGIVEVRGIVDHSQG